jgi:hypothetical protein
MTYRPGYKNEVPNEERVRILLKDLRPRYNCQANFGVILSDVGENIRTRAEILSAIDRAGDERRIILAPAVQQALDAAKERHPLNDFRAQAFEKIILDKAEELKWDLTSAQNLSDICDWLLEQQDVPLTYQGREAQQQLRGVEKRTDEINQITNNYTSGFKIRTPNGGVKVYDKDGYEVQFSAQGGRAKPRDGGFDAMTDDEISAICEQLRTERRMRGMTKDALRAEIDPNRKKAYQDSSVSMSETPVGTLLYHPDTKAPITTKRELILAINSSVDATKRMLQRHGTRGLETDKTLAREFERLLNS